MGNRLGQILSIIKDTISWTGDPAVWIINLANELSCKQLSLPLPLKWAFLLLFNGQWNSHQPVFSPLPVSSNPPFLSRSMGSHWACPEHFVSLLPSLSLTPYMPPLTPSVSNCTTHSLSSSPTSYPAVQTRILPRLSGLQIVCLSSPLEY